MGFSRAMIFEIYLRRLCGLLVLLYLLFHAWTLGSCPLHPAPGTPRGQTVGGMTARGDGSAERRGGQGVGESTP